MNLNTVSENLLFAVKMQKETASFLDSLRSVPFDKLVTDLNTDKKKKAFWINMYNALFQILRNEYKITKPDIYKKKLSTIAGVPFSLDDIEHGVLRKYRYKYSFGFMANIFAPKIIKRLAVDKIDYRIHFALNCGAESCPPIAFYSADKIGTQLDMATQSFLEGESTYDDEHKIMYTTALFQWFKKDFGGKKGIIQIYKNQLNKDIREYKIKYNSYSWEEELHNFQ